MTRSVAHNENLARSASSETPAVARPATADMLYRLIKPLATLRLTVTLFALSTFLVFAGTLAQVDRGIWTVVDEYFRTAIAWIELSIFFPRSWNVPDVAFPFPGGWLIGGLLLANLVTAHALLFKVKAEGRRRTIGLLVMALGFVVTGLVLAGFFQPQVAATEDDAFWRVLWRLLYGEIGAAVVLVACVMLFRARAGIVLLHAGIILLLVSELVTGLLAVEATMTLAEGETVNFVDVSQRSELAIIDTSDPSHDTVIAVPGSLLARDGTTLKDDQLPFDIEVVRYMVNSDPPASTISLQEQLGEVDQQIAQLGAMETPPPFLIQQANERKAALNKQLEFLSRELATTGVTAGTGRQMLVRSRAEGSGVDPSAKQDSPALIATFKDKATGQAIGTYLVAYWFYPNFVGRLWDIPQKVEAGGKTYSVYFRPQRIYKPYALNLVEFTHEKYLGTSKPKDFASRVKVFDEGGKELRTVRIWMNNPLRYSGETFYQSGVLRDDEGTILQVVKNVGWMVPYVACMIVATGMVAHMGSHLWEFLRKRLGA